MKNKINIWDQGRKRKRRKLLELPMMNNGSLSKKITMTITKRKAERIVNEVAVECLILTKITNKQKLRGKLIKLTKMISPTTLLKNNKVHVQEEVDNVWPNNTTNIMIGTKMMARLDHEDLNYSF